MSHDPTPSRSNQAREHPLADPVLDVLLQQADAARRFELEVLGAAREQAPPRSTAAHQPMHIASSDEPTQEDGLGLHEHDALVTAPLPGRTIAWRTARWAGVGLAAAASLAVGVVLFSRSTPTHTTPGPIARVTPPKTVEPTITPVRASLNDSDLAHYAYLDDGVDGPGLPTLTGERELVMAVRTTSLTGTGDSSTHACNCLGWSVGEPGSVAMLKDRVLQQTLGSGCGTSLTDIVLVRVTGPRNELPMHDEDARAWAACIAEAPRFCAKSLPPDESPADQSACEQLVAMDCIPQGLDLIVMPLLMGP